MGNFPTLKSVKLYSNFKNNQTAKKNLFLETDGLIDNNCGQKLTFPERPKEEKSKLDQLGESKKQSKQIRIS